jgi:prepilin-type N-terminal cleavage/methylation domain-containing protein
MRHPLPRKHHMPLNRQRGFSLLEMLAVVAIGFILAGMTFVAMLPILNRSHVDNAYETTMAVLRDTRHLAITQSHQYYVNFNPTGFPAGTMQVTYQPAAVGGVLPPVQQVNTYTLPTTASL